MPTTTSSRPLHDVGAVSPFAPAASPEPIYGNAGLPARRKLAIINLLAVLLPLVGLAGAIVLLWGDSFNWTYLAIMGGMAVLTAGGVTVGYHRLCTHKSFATSPLLRYLLASAGSMAVQGPVIAWCAEHRKHHQHSDAEGDPHSPHFTANGSWGQGLRATLKGAVHAHVGWLFAPASQGLDKYAVDLRRDRAIVLANRHFELWVIAGLVLPAILGGLLSMSWMGVLLGFLWGGLVRVLLVHHITWSVNSVCHLWGTRPFESRDESRNNALVGLLALGEGWHNNHHAFPTSARHGLRWWELDLSYIFIRLLELLRLARDVRLPSAERIRSRMRRRHEGALVGAADERPDSLTGQPEDEPTHALHHL
jgi:stearoyl-CoA desaturase (delta-9 desaturase)